MKRHSLWLNVLLLLPLLLSGAGPLKAAMLPEDDGTALSALPSVDVGETLHNSPVMFIENVGQFDEGARFQVRGGNGALWLADDALWITIVEPLAVSDQQSAGQIPQSEIQNQRSKVVNLRLSFPGANPNARLEPFDRLETTVSYFIGNDPEGWRPAVPVWGGARYVDLYPGIDLEVTGEGGRFVQRLHAQPGADLSQVRVRIEGAEAVELTATGSLRLSTAMGDYTLPLLAVEAAPADAHAMIHTAETGAFDIAAPFAVRHSPTSLSYPQSAIQNQDDPPSLVYSTFLGGGNFDFGNGIAVDNAGNTYVTGNTISTDFPTLVGPDLSYNGGPIDGFVAKINATGTGLVYAGFLGGSSIDACGGIAVDGAGNVYITGWSNSNDFPVTGGLDLTYNGGEYDAIVAKINAAGTELVYAGFLGGNGWDTGSGIAVDSAGSAYVTGRTSSDNFPVTVGPDLTYNGGERDAFIAKVNAAGSALVYVGFLGGSSDDVGYGIAVDGAGNAYLIGETQSADFPVVVGPGLTFGGGICGTAPDTYPCADAFVAKINAAGTELTYAGFLGGSDADVGYGIAVDVAGNAYVTGHTTSTDFPAIGGPDLTHNGSGDAFVAKINAAGSGAVYAGFLGGSGSESGRSIELDNVGNVYIVGGTNSIDFPVIGGPDLTYNGGYVDAFIAKINAAGMGLVYASFLGGSREDSVGGIAVDGAGSAYIVGQTTSADFPTTMGAFDTTYSNTQDAFVVKIEEGDVAPTYSVSGRVVDSADNAIVDVTITIDGDGSTVTDNDGNYTFSGVNAGAYILTPTKPGWVFMPPTRTVILPPDATGQDFTMLHPPVSITLSLSGTASLPASLSYVDTQGLTTTVMFPAGAVTATTTIVLTPTVPIAGSALAFAGHAFDMEAYQGGVRQPDFTFVQPVLVTIHYSQQDVRLIADENQLALYRWEGGAWADAACDAYIRQLSENWLTAPICRLSHFAFFGPTNRIYLPLVLRNR